jgi:hypothetical protein
MSSVDRCGAASLIETRDLMGRDKLQRSLQDRGTFDVISYPRVPPKHGFGCALA